MASLVVAGDVSGSVTLSAPSAAGSTVITLPTTSGTMVVTGGAQTVQFAAGSAASPSITFTGDTNTGIFSPAADTIAFSEGGVESMRIDASGNVGIGTTSGLGKLSVKGSDANTLWLVGRASDGTSSVSFRNNADSAYNARIECFDTGVMTFATGTSATERMRITSTGDVGIGTTSPKSVGNYRFVTTNATTGSGYSVQVNGTEASNFYANSSATVIQEVRALPLVFETNATERMRISSGGDVFIGGTTALANGALMVGDNSTTRPLVLRGAGGVDGTYINSIAFYPWNTTEVNVIRTSVSGSAGGSGFQFMVSNGFGTSGITESFRINRTSCTVIGSLSKGSGSFKIDHPLPELNETHHLVHSFIEGPQADLIYRGVVTLIAGKATVNIDEAAGMTEGTFVALNREVQCFTTNESDWTAVRGKVVGNILTIEAQDLTATSTISWMVIGERKDKHMYDTEWTDENGKVIVEPLKQAKGAN